MTKHVKSLLLGITLFCGSLFAQQDSNVQNTKQSDSLQQELENLKGKLNGLEESYLETKSTVDKLKKIKISGYVQTQIRVATDTSGQVSKENKNNYDIGEFQGGKLPAITQSVFQVRRARLKLGYETALSQMYIQLDCLPFTTGNAVNEVTQATDSTKKVSTKTGAFLNGGGVSIKDAYFKFNDPWTKSIGLKMGVFDRPFGYEISYSSSSRESPERSRVFQTLFPGERDLGIAVEYLPGDNLPVWAQHFNLKSGLFSGNGINVEFDDIRDIIGRIGFSLPLNNINMSIDGGFSGYYGYVRDRDSSLYKIVNNEWVGTKGHKWEHIGRQYVGGDLELYYGNIPFFGGMSLRGEYISGQQPGTASSSVSQKSDIASSSSVYLRNFSGFYGMAVLNVDPLKCQLVGKYDVYDPNTDVDGQSQIKMAADMKYSTIGTGIVYHILENVKLMAYYDIVKNEQLNQTSAAKTPWLSKELNDNVFTLRVQYKF
jgi:hypothetical protein